MAVACPACGEPSTGGEWCEACGADLDGNAYSALSNANAEPCVSCAAPSTEIAADGYCSQCGHKQPDPRDHLEDDLGWLVMVTDRGNRHHRNEDFGAAAQVGDNSVMVVCDGVSTTDNPEQASLAATTAAVEVLVAALNEESVDHRAAMAAAVKAAQQATLAVPAIVGGKGSPSCTFVASITSSGIDGLETTIGWLGDSRAYWIDDTGAVTQLTTDHSWASEQVADGLMTPEEANADSRAHTITRWLGEDAHEIEPGIVTHSAPSGRLLLCSDGLWNYADTDETMTHQVAAHDDGSLIVLAQNLVTYALESGGHDNTTVAIADHSAQPDPAEPKSDLPEESTTTTAAPEAAEGDLVT